MSRRRGVTLLDVVNALRAEAALPELRTPNGNLPKPLPRREPLSYPQRELLACRTCGWPVWQGEGGVFAGPVGAQPHRCTTTPSESATRTRVGPLRAPNAPPPRLWATREQIGLLKRLRAELGVTDTADLPDLAGLTFERAERMLGHLRVAVERERERRGG